MDGSDGLRLGSIVLIVAIIILAVSIFGIVAIINGWKVF